MDKTIIKILTELKKILSNKFNNIDKVILFGSQITKKNDQYSDHDILVILDGKYNWKTENSILDEAYKIDLKYGILTDIKIISKHELKGKRGAQPYIEDALLNGIAV